MHITGGGFPENIPRIVPKGKDLGFRIRRGAWDVPPLFQWLQQARQSPGSQVWAPDPLIAYNWNELKRWLGGVGKSISVTCCAAGCNHRAMPPQHANRELSMRECLALCNSNNGPCSYLLCLYPASSLV